MFIYLSVLLVGASDLLWHYFDYIHMNYKPLNSINNSEETFSLHYF